MFKIQTAHRPIYRKRQDRPASDATPVTTLAKDRCRIDQTPTLPSSWGSTRTSCITSTTKRSNIRKFPSTPLTRRSTLRIGQKISLLHNRNARHDGGDDEDDENGGHGNAYGAAEENRRLELHPVYGSANHHDEHVEFRIWATTDVKIDPEFYAKFLSAPMFKMQGSEKIIAEMKKIKGVPVQ